uniref:response regulator n=1 Tax=Salmonella sp. SAL4449 TaxID=3159904 RepID=UPI00397CF90F
MPLILVIDDDPMVHQLVAHALAPLQCDLHFAENGKSGLSHARQLKPDVIITDVK